LFWYENHAESIIVIYAEMNDHVASETKVITVV